MILKVSNRSTGNIAIMPPAFRRTRYQPGKIERKWQKTWAKQAIFTMPENTRQEKRYLLVEFPYPSGDGLHVGHVRSYSALDALARQSRMKGFAVLYPIGWDAFGLPTENYAIKTGTHPRQATDKNIATFRKQMKALGLSFDWSREIDTTDPKYYKWTQWIFLQLHKKGLAYQATIPINWCPKDKIGLANEEVIAGKCERCGTEVTRRLQKQWMLRITAYADRLLEDLDTVDYLPKIKTQQVNWIGKSEGAEIEFPVRLNNQPASGKKVILLRGYKGSPSNEEGYFDWLKSQLDKRGYSVQIPDLPDPDDPSVENQVNFVLKNCQFDEATILLGHSLGSVVALKTLERLKKPIAKLVLVAGFSKPNFIDHARPFEKKFNWQYDWKIIKENASTVIILRDTGDDTVPHTAAEMLRKNIGGRIIDSQAQKPHFRGGQEPAVFDALLPQPELLIGTRNPAKVKMIQRAFAPFPEIRLITLDEVGDIDDADLVEGDDYRANARLKAEYYFKRTGIPTVSTDHILWLDKWPKDRGFITHIRKLANPKSKRATDDEVASWLEKLIRRQGESRTSFHYAIGYADGSGVQDFVSIQREYMLKSNPAKARWEGYVVDRFLRDPKTDEYRATQGEEIAFSKFFHFVRNEFVPKIFSAQSIKVFTTRPDTLFGATYLVLAPEHEAIQNSKFKIENFGEVEKYIEQAAKKSDLDRTDLAKVKTGVELKGVSAINPATGGAIPIWAADYVLGSYGTGAIMAVPAHDERDYEFAKKYDLPIRQVIAPYFTKNKEDKDAIRPDKKTVKRKTAYALVYSKKKNAFLCLDWEKYDWRSGIIGGVDEGESYEEAARREISEETGYVNLKFVKYLGGEQHNHFFATHKDENRYAYGQGMLFELVDEKTEPVSAEHTKHHQAVWIEKAKMGEWLNLASFNYIWKSYISDSNCYIGEGKIINSGRFNGQDSRAGGRAIVSWLAGRKKPNVIIVHGCGDNSEDQTYDKHWMSWLSEQLIQKGIAAEVPLMPTSWQANYREWKLEFEKQDVNEETILIGHSCGTAFLVRWLGESKRKVKMLILVAPWKIARQESKYYQKKKKFYTFDIDHSISERVGRIVMFTSENEDDRGKASLTMYHDVLGGEVIELLNHGHYLTEHMGTAEFPELLELLKEFFEVGGGAGLGSARFAVQYKLRDWVFSRQHYWGEPIPIIHCEKCGAVPVPEKDLPVMLPYVKKYQPTDTGESPLAAISKWVNTKCPVCQKPAKRETDTMPNWAGSSWYYLRYCDPRNDRAFADRKKLDHWLPVDIYNGGMEHTTLHLLYSRFWHKFLFDQGLVPNAEPYRRRHSHGMVLAEDGRKMSKSFGNVINPVDLVNEKYGPTNEIYGADALRMYEMFMGPFEDTIPWSTNGLIGVRRFLDRVYTVFTNNIGWGLLKTYPNNAIRQKREKIIHSAIKKISNDIENFKFNTIVSSLMECFNVKTNEIGSLEGLTGEDLLQRRWGIQNDIEIFLLLLFPIAPHLASELWEIIVGGDISKKPWPNYDAQKLLEEVVVLVVQINGKMRDRITLPADASEADATKQAKSRDKIQKFLAGRDPKKVIYVKGKIINLVVPNV